MTPGEWIQQYTRNFEMIVQACRDRIHIFETFNEPDDWHRFPPQDARDAFGNLWEKAWIHPTWLAHMLQSIYQRVKPHDVKIIASPLQGLRPEITDGPKTYLGLAMEGFPNLFTVTGPGSPSVFTNMLPSIEQHCEWISDCIVAMRAAGRDEIEAEADAEAAWGAHNLDVAEVHLRSSCSSWYTGENIAGKPKVFMPYIGGFPTYVARCEEIVANGYEGFRFG